MRPRCLLLCILISVTSIAADAGLDPSRITHTVAIKNALVSALVMGDVALLEDASTIRLTDGTIIRTDSTTQLTGLVAPTELSSGDLIQAEGQWAGDGTLRANWLRLVQRGAAQTTREGTVLVLTPPDLLRLEDGLTVRVHTQTTYVGIAGFDSLATGDRIQVVGTFAADALFAATAIQLLEAAEPITTAFETTVAAIRSPSRLVDNTGIEITVNAATVLVGFVSLAELGSGSRLWVEGHRARNVSTITATRLVLLGNEGDRLELVTQIAQIGLPDRFFTKDDRTVRVSQTTRWIGIQDLSGLGIGDTVRVLGTVSSESLTVFAEEVARVEGEDSGGASDNSGSGLVIRTTSPVKLIAPPDLFVLHNGRSIRTTGATSWQGDLTGVSDLVPGVVVRVVATMGLGGALEAANVGRVGRQGAQAQAVTGRVALAFSNGRLQLEDGSFLEITEETAIDGEIDEAAEIQPGMSVTASAVEVSESTYLALWLYVEGKSATEPAFPDYAGGGFVAHEALVVVVDTADPVEVAARHDATLVGTLPGRLVHLFRWLHPVTEEEVLGLLADSETEEVEANYSFQDPESIRRSMPVIDRQATSERYNAQAATNFVGLEAAHARSQGVGTMVAVVDTGVDPFHPVLRHRIAGGGLDLVDDDSEPWEEADGIDQDGDGDVDEATGHGTFVAGLVVLVAPATTILPYRVLDDEGHGTTFAICRAVLAAVDRGADVISMSFAYEQRSRVLDRILDEAVQRGVVLVSGAGNGSTDDLPFPARDHRVLAVGAVNDTGQLADFSNWGESVPLGAPGVDVYSGLDDGNFGTWSGTSMAAPLVSGTAALLRSVNPYLSPDDVAAALTQGARTPPAGEPLGGLLDAAASLALVPDVP